MDEMVHAIRDIKATVDKAIPFDPNMAAADVTTIRKEAFSILFRRWLRQTDAIRNVTGFPDRRP